MTKNVNIPLNAQELAALETFLAKGGDRDSIFLQGFLYAIILTPRLATLDEWFPMFFERHEIFKNSQESKVVVSLIGRLAYQIKSALELPVPKAPILTETSVLGDLAEQVDIKLMENWAKGFFLALRLDKKYWFGVKEPVRGAIQILLCLVEDDEAILVRMGREAQDLGVYGMRRKAIIQLPQAIKALYKFRRRMLKNKSD